MSTLVIDSLSPSSTYGERWQRLMKHLQVALITPTSGFQIVGYITRQPTKFHQTTMKNDKVI
jgi:hypothetical protein